MVSGFQARSYEAKDMTTESTITRCGEPVGAELCELVKGQAGRTNRRSSLLTGNGMVAPGRCYASLIPSHPFAGRIAASVQHRGNLVVAVANSHATNNLQCLHRRGASIVRSSSLRCCLRAARAAVASL